LIPGAYAVSLGGGASVSSTNGHAEGIIASSDMSALSQASFTGSDVNYNNWLDDTTGKHVEESLKIVQGSGTYNCVFKKGTTIVNPDSVNHIVPASSSLSASQQLDVTNAKEIYAGAAARNGEGDLAGVDVRILMGSITGYKNSVTATSTKATASQSATSASGNAINSQSIMFNSLANNREQDNASPHLNIQGGSVTGYASSATATMTNAAASQSATSASGSFIEFLTRSNNRELDNVSPSLKVYDGSVKSYVSSGTATMTTAAASQRATSASGSFIEFLTRSNNRELDNVSPSLKVYDGSVTGYASSGTATMNKAAASQSATSAYGSFIEFLTISDNIKPGNASPSLVVDDGSVKSYVSSGTATMTTAAASQRATSASGSSVIWDNL